MSDRPAFSPVLPEALTMADRLYLHAALAGDGTVTLEMPAEDMRALVRDLRAVEGVRDRVRRAEEEVAIYLAWRRIRDARSEARLYRWAGVACAFILANAIIKLAHDLGVIG